MCDYQGREFGASYPDSVCIDGLLWDADSGDACDGGWCYTNGGQIRCPQVGVAPKHSRVTMTGYFRNLQITHRSFLE